MTCYRARAYNSSSISDPSNSSIVIIEDVSNEKVIDDRFVLNQNYPNPFNPNTVISYQLPTANYVTLKIYDLMGREVGTLVNECQPAGTYNSALNTYNLKLSSGIYFYKLQAGNFIQTKKMILLK